MKKLYSVMLKCNTSYGVQIFADSKEEISKAFNIDSIEEIEIEDPNINTYKMDYNIYVTGNLVRKNCTPNFKDCEACHNDTCTCAGHNDNKTLGVNGSECPNHIAKPYIKVS